MCLIKYYENKCSIDRHYRPSEKSILTAYYKNGSLYGKYLQANLLQILLVIFSPLSAEKRMKINLNANIIIMAFSFKEVTDEVISYYFAYAYIFHCVGHFFIVEIEKKVTTL